MLSTQQERSFKWIDLSEWWWREERWTSRESLPAISTWGYPSGLTDVREHWVWCFLSVWPRPHSNKSEEFLLYYSQAPLGSWNLVNPLLSMNEAWMDDCAARLKPLVDQHKAQTTPTFCNRKILRFDRNNPIHSLGQKIYFWKFLNTFSERMRRLSTAQNWTIYLCSGCINLISFSNPGPWLLTALIDLWNRRF